MTPTDEGALLSIRRSRMYRTAIWLARVANLAVVPVVFWGLLAMVEVLPGLPNVVFFGAWLVGAVALVPAFVLLHRSGVLPERRGLGWVVDQRIGNAILRDVFWRREP